MCRLFPGPVLTLFIYVEKRAVAVCIACGWRAFATLPYFALVCPSLISTCLVDFTTGAKYWDHDM